MSDRLLAFQARARELAGSGNFKGWRQVAFKLQFESGFAEAFPWLYAATTQAELDDICRAARYRVGNDAQSSFSERGFPKEDIMSRHGKHAAGFAPRGRLNMTYVIGGCLLLIIIFVYAAVETRLELSRDNQKLTEEDQVSGLSRSG